MNPDDQLCGADAVRRALGWAAAALGGTALFAGLVVAPPDALQGQAARLMYVHVPAAWTAYLAFAVTVLSGIAYLRGRDPRWDRRARAAAELGVGLTALTLALGSLWGRASWGVWWAWDPRVMSTALLLVVYTGYLAARQTAADPPSAARRGAFLGIAGFTLVPVVHFSVVWWRSLHQRATLLAPEPHPPIDPVMLAALTLAVAAFTTTTAWLFLRRVAMLERADRPSVRAAPAGAGR